MSELATLAARLHAAYEPLGRQGRCGGCGDSDRRHRVGSAITGRMVAGDAPEGVAEDYGVTVAEALTIGFLTLAVWRHCAERGLDREQTVNAIEAVWPRTEEVA
jgi:hypothetical protein